MRCWQLQPGDVVDQLPVVLTGLVCGIQRLGCLRSLPSRHLLTNVRRHELPPLCCRYVQPDCNWSNCMCRMLDWSRSKLLYEDL